MQIVLAHAHIAEVCLLVPHRRAMFLFIIIYGTHKTQEWVGG